MSAKVGLFHPQTGDRQSQETFLAPSADKKPLNYDKECSNHHPYQSPLSNGIDLQQDKLVSNIYKNLPRNDKVRLIYSKSGQRQGQETFLAPYVDKHTYNSDTELSNQNPSKSP